MLSAELVAWSASLESENAVDLVGSAEKFVLELLVLDSQDAVVHPAVARLEAP